MNSLNALAQAIETHNSFVIIAHVNMDGDALGSAAALALALKEKGKQCFFKGEGEVPGQLSLLAGIKKLLELPEMQQYDAAIAVDCAEYERMGIYAPLFLNARFKICIDHHETNKGFGDINYIKSYPASAQCVYELLKQLRVNIHGEIAECLYAAFLTDTGRFSHSDVTRETMLAAASLYDAGFDTARVNKLIFGTRTFSASRLLGRGLEKLELFFNGRVSVIALTQQDFEQCGANEGDSEGIVNYALEVAGVEAAVFLRQRGGGYKISLRSAGKLDVADIASQFGGGGHRLAAGCTVNGELDQVKDRIIQMIAQKAGYEDGN